NTIRIWEAATGKELSPTIGHQGAVSSVALTSDGKLLASASQDGTIRIWNPDTAKEIRVLSGAGKEEPSGVGWLKKAIGGLIGMPTYEEGFTSVIFSPDQKTLISVGTQGTVRVWDAATGKDLP